ncbi:MAG: thioesterase domain-containing protein [Betaproteobacteria bacterium]
MVPALLEELRIRDIRLRAEGDRLQCDAPAGALTPELREQLRRRKNEILEFLRQADSLARQQRAIVPLQPLGTNVPVFGVGGHNGDVFCYRALAHQLGREQPFFGLQPPGLDGHSEPLTRVENYAAYFAPQIRSFWSNGPYVIAGFCAGGGIAFELARQLAEEGAEIAFLALFGSPFPTAYRTVPQLRMRLARQADRLVKHARALAPLSFRDQRRYLAMKLGERHTRLEAARPSEPDAVLAMRARVEKATLAAVQRYTPAPFPGHVALFLPSRSWTDTPDIPLHWRTVARTSEEYCGPDECNGDVMLREQYAGIFAELFKHCRDASRSMQRVERQAAAS